MKISLEWLREYAQLDAPVAHLVNALVDTGDLDEVGREATRTQVEPASVAVRVGESSPLSHSGRA